MTEPGVLDDDELIERARRLRLLALRGDRYAHGPAHVFEVEVRRRMRETSTQMPLERNLESRPFWRFW
jgi:hypothetical protein